MYSIASPRLAWHCLQNHQLAVQCRRSSPPHFGHGPLHSLAALLRSGVFAPISATRSTLLAASIVVRSNVCMIFLPIWDAGTQWDAEFYLFL